jgi:uncharacterized protein (TIGR03437 family)
MRKLLTFLFLAGLACAQTVETIPFRAVLSPANEVPAITDLSASGAGTIWLHVVRDAGGQIVSGSVDFNVDYSFPGEVTLTGMHIHSGAAGVNGPVTISSGLTAPGTVSSPEGRGSIRRQAQVPPTSTGALDTLKGLLQDPSQYYLNLHTAVNPAGVLRGQLQRAEMLVLMGLMSPSNEVPAVSLNASAVASVIVLRTRDSSGNLTSGQVIFDANYTFPEQVTFTGFHIHTGAAGVSGPVTINSGLAGSVASGAGGVGNLHYEAEVNVRNIPALELLEGLFSNPGNYYINVHTSALPAGALRAQLHFTDRASFQAAMLPSNELPPVTLPDASALAAVTVYTLRGSDGNALAGTVLFDVNPRFSGLTEFTGLHIHNGTAAENGPVTVNSGISASNSVATETGFLNIYKPVTVSAATGLATVNSLLRNPENHYVNLHTTTNPAGVVRAQLAAASTALPRVGAVISAITDPARNAIAPGGLMTIFGENFAKVSSGLAGLVGETLPTSMNGTEVTVAGQKVPLVVVSPSYVVAQLPFETAPGSQPVLVRNASGVGSAGSVTVARSAPAIFFDSVGGIVLNNANYGLIRPGNPARAGDVLLIYSTGLGQTTPASETGRIVPFPPQADTAPVAVTLGGKSADVVYSIAAPGYVGLYQTAVRVPSGLTPGNAALTLRLGDATSNTVTLAVQ